MKKISFIRHGKSSHNLDFNEKGVDAYIDILHTDSSLLQEGFTQCKEIIEENKQFFDNILTDDFVIVVSPLKRCIMTTLKIFENYNLPREKIVCIEHIREYPCGIHTPNKRMCKETLEHFYDKYIDFSDISVNKDIYWNKEREESIDELDTRILLFKKWLNNRNEKNIIVVSHSSFIGKMLFDDIDYDIKHKKIYEYSI